MKASIPKFSQNGSRDHTGIGKSWNWTRRGNKDDQEPE
jgi:hypothetical protein